MKTNFKLAIAVAVLLHILPYHIDFLETSIYFNYFGSETKAQMEMMEMQSKNSSGLLSLFPAYRSPLKYHPFYSIIQVQIEHLFSFLKYKQYVYLLLFLIQKPLFLLTCFSKIVLFKKLNLNALASIVYPFNYISLIDKFKLSNKWKLFLLIPFFNFYIMYKINIEIVKLLKLPNSNSLGMIFLPFIYYPKLVSILRWKLQQQPICN